MIDKYSATCPRTITPAIRDFAQEIAGSSELCYVSNHPLSFCMPRMCYLNVFRAKSILGGEPILGFMIWATRDLFLTAEHHCVLRTPDGALIDVTPDITNQKQILFVATGEEATPDAIREIVMNGKTGHYRVLANHPLIHRAVAVLDESATRLQRENNIALAAGMPRPAAERRRWSETVTQMERLIDRYYHQQQQRTDDRDNRRKNKLKRHARKKARAYR